jgi:Tol biopolymer transport system component
LDGGPLKTVLDTEGPKFPADWSSDGRFLAFNSQWPEYRDMHLWTMQIDDARAPGPLSQHPYSELAASFSPAGKGKSPRWIAYTSEDTGRDEVYIRDFPSGRLRWTASTHGGWMPHWRRDGRELFYLTLEGTLMSVAVHDRGALELGAPEPLFDTGLRPAPMRMLMNQYAVSAGGQRFLLNQRIANAPAPALTVVVGW